jgi:hypothetical protein
VIFVRLIFKTYLDVHLIDESIVVPIESMSTDSGYWISGYSLSVHSEQQPLLEQVSEVHVTAICSVPILRVSVAPVERARMSAGVGHSRMLTWQELLMTLASRKPWQETRWTMLTLLMMMLVPRVETASLELPVESTIYTILFYLKKTIISIITINLITL